MLLNKREVLGSFDDFVDNCRNDDYDEPNSESRKEILLSLCEKFRNELEKHDIPTLTEPWFYYEYAVTNEGIELTLCKCDDVYFDDDGGVVIFDDTEQTILRTKCDYMTVAQYADLNDVMPVTVRKWIRRGKLRSARKQGRNWLIPALAKRTSHIFESVAYSWGALGDNIINAFPFLISADSVHIEQDNEYNDTFYAIPNCPGSFIQQEITLTASEREKLEYMLIASPDIIVKDYTADFQYMPSKPQL
jgi:hypothetical protein